MSDQVGNLEDQFSHNEAHIEAVVEYMRRITRKSVFVVSDQVRHKQESTSTEDGKKLEMTDLGSRGIVLSM